jgi:hypothetical protein
MKKIIFSLILSLSIPAMAEGNWSWNLGYHNPHTATYGLNFMHVWTDWAVEFGLGYIQIGNGASQTSGLTLGGDINLKYIFLHSLLRPYLQGGYGMSSGVNGNGAGLGIAGAFVGGGLYIWANEFYVYGSYDIADGGGSFYQFGLGFPF